MTPNPMGCGRCGIDQRGHGIQYGATGHHTWQQPTQQQIKQRMKARRAARLFATSLLAGVEEWKKSSLAAAEASSRLFFALPDPIETQRGARQAAVDEAARLTALRDDVRELENQLYAEDPSDRADAYLALQAMGAMEEDQP